jgi:hypothetical protein
MSFPRLPDCAGARQFVKGVAVISSLVSNIVLAGLTCVSMVLYLSPLVVGWTRRAPGIGAIAVINILLGWTLVGWVVALAMAFRPSCAAKAMPGTPPRPWSWSRCWSPWQSPGEPADTGGPGGAGQTPGEGEAC